MANKSTSEEISSLKEQVNLLKQRCAEAEQALDAIHHGEVDAFVVYSNEGEKIYTLQGVETTYRLLVESMNEGAATLIEDGTILYCNRRFAELIKTPLESIIATSIDQYLPPASRAVFSKLLAMGLKENCRGEFELLQKDGGRIPVMVSLNRFSSDSTPGVCLVASNLTDRKKVEDLIQKDAQRAHTFSDFSRALVEVSLDEKAILDIALRTAAQLIGEAVVVHILSSDGNYLNLTAHYHPNPEIDQVIFNYLSPYPLEQGEGLSWQVIRSGEPMMIPSINRKVLKRAIKPEFYKLVSQTDASSLLIVPIRTHDRTIGSMVLARYSKDPPHTEQDLQLVQRIANQAALAITNARLYQDLHILLEKEKIMRLQLIQAEKLSALSRMMTTVVHEINNPVQTIKNCLYLAQMDIPYGSAAQDSLNMASSEIDRISKLVSGLRDIYRQPKSVEMVDLDLIKLLTDVHVLLESHLQHHNVTWLATNLAGPIWIRGISDHLKQVFLNISMNAIEAMEPVGGSITLYTTSDASTHEVGVAITDTGCGIPPENIPALFEPFFTTKEGGSGLGLPICYEIVQRHSGHIAVESTLNEGSTFTVWLPTISLSA